MHRGDIVRVKQYYFENTGEVRDKYFIILSDTNKYLDIVFVFTTSKLEEYESLSEDEKVCIPLWRIQCLSKKTLVVIKNTHRVERSMIESYKRVNFWTIPEDILNEITLKVQKHPEIKPYIKKMAKE